MAIGGSILTVIGFYSSPAGGELWKVIFNRSLALFAIWATAILSVQRKTIYDEKEKALFDLKILSGLLPICASCKKIRDDKGYWNQIELYIRDRSEVTVSTRTGRFIAELNLVVSSTNREKLPAQETCDIINPSS